MIIGSNLAEKRENQNRKYGDKGKIRTLDYSIESFARQLGINKQILEDLENGEMTFEGLKKSGTTAEMVAKICQIYEVEPEDFFRGEEDTDDFRIEVNNAYDVLIDEKIKEARKNIYQDEEESKKTLKLSKRFKGIFTLAVAIFFGIVAKKAFNPVNVYTIDDSYIGYTEDNKVVPILEGSLLIESGHSRKESIGDGITIELVKVTVYDEQNGLRKNISIHKGALQQVAAVSPLRLMSYKYICKEEDFYALTNGMVREDGTIPIYSFKNDAMLTYEFVPEDEVKLLIKSGTLELPDGMDRLDGVLETAEGFSKGYVKNGIEIDSPATIDSETISDFIIKDGDLVPAGKKERHKRWFG